jgi:hypothetical protein
MLAITPSKRRKSPRSARGGRCRRGPEAQIVHDIRTACRLLGVPCFRLNSGAMVLTEPSRRFFQASFTGCPDLVMLLRDGRTLWCECKAENGRMSPNQVEFQRLCTVHNVPHVVARCWEDVKVWVR